MPTRTSYQTHPSPSHILETTDSRCAPSQKAREVDEPQEFPLCAQTEQEAALQSAYEDYRQCTGRGDAVDLDAFCAQYPSTRSALARLLDVDECLTRDQEDEASRFPSVGSDYLGFQVVRELGRGSVARVYLAREEALGGRRVVLKISRSGDSEAVALGRLDHPNIVQIHCAFEDIDRRLITLCMPYEGNVTLRMLINQLNHLGARPDSGDELAEVAGKLEVQLTDAEPANRTPHAWRGMSYHQAVCHIGCQLAAALAHAHRQGIAHLDIKPANVLITHDGRVKLLDFNLAHDSTCRAELRGGTPRYMPPEQYDSLAFSTEEFDPQRADIYSVGAVLYEMLTGEAPYRPLEADPQATSGSGGSSAFTARRVYDPNTYVPVRQCNRKVPAALAGIIDRCLSLQPEERPASAEELRLALRDAMTTTHRHQFAAHVSWITSAARTVLSAAVFCAVIACAMPSPVESPRAAAEAARQTAPPEVPVPTMRRAISLVRSGRAEEAMQVIRRQSEGIRADAFFRSWCGYISWRIGDAKAARAYAETAAEFDPRDYRHRYNAAVALYARGFEKFAFDEVEKSIAVAPYVLQPRLLRLYLWRQTPEFLNTRIVREDLDFVLPRMESWELYEIAAQAEIQSRTADIDRLKWALANAKRLGAPEDVLAAYTPLLLTQPWPASTPAPKTNGLRRQVYDFLEPRSAEVTIASAR